MELEGNRPGVVVTHALVRLERDIVARLDDLAGREADGVALDKLLGQGLGRCDGGGVERGEEVGGVTVLTELRVEGLGTSQ